jgi:hypothetical protein
MKNKLPKGIEINSHIDLGDLCVWCLEDTSMGSGRFVNRISVEADASSAEWFENLKEAQKEYVETVEGYGCTDCYSEECTKCGKRVDMDFEVRDDNGNWFHPECLHNRDRREEDRKCDSCGEIDKDANGDPVRQYASYYWWHPSCADFDQLAKERAEQASADGGDY